MTDEKLIAAADEMLSAAYAPYSGFRVGAAILAEDGRVFTGCNVENASYGCCICAERTAAVKAVSEGAVRFTAAAVVSSGGDPTYPCGICRQFLREFGGDKMKMIFREKDGSLTAMTMGELMPHGFDLDK